jgi:gluconate kinase
MITWLTGNTGAGKTAMAKKLLARNEFMIHLDGDEMRVAINRGLTLTAQDRRENCLNIARLAKLLDKQGFDVVVSVIAPYRDLRADIQTLTDCEFWYLPDGAQPSLATPYEIPTRDEACWLPSWVDENYPFDYRPSLWNNTP